MPTRSYKNNFAMKKLHIERTKYIIANTYRPLEDSSHMISNDHHIFIWLSDD
jgi:hypothetical protein